MKGEADGVDISNSGLILCETMKCDIDSTS